MLGQPEAAVTPLLDVLGEFGGAGDGGGGGFAGAHADEIERGRREGSWTLDE